MKIIFKKVFITVLTAVLLAGATLPCFAAAKTGKITVVLEDEKGNSINGAVVNACQIAELNNTGYYPAQAFENSGISIAGIVNNPNEAAAKTLADYLQNNNICELSATAQNGRVTFTDLGLGIWLVFPTKTDKYTFNPYIVFLPYESGANLSYEVTSTPKIQDNTPDKINIYLVKKWDDKNNAAKKRPNAVTVDLLNGDEAVASVVLSDQNGWAHTFMALSKEGDYSVKERAVANYKADYSGDFENGFVVTNTYSGEKLPQTGQYWWPIILIAIAGVCFILLGVYEIGVKKNAKKK